MVAATMTVDIAWDAIYQRFVRTVISFMDIEIEAIEALARKQAPVRKVFYGTYRQKRGTTLEEATRDLPTRLALGLAPAVANSRKQSQIVTKINRFERRMQDPRFRIVRNGRLRPSSMQMLNAAGMNELKRRAIPDISERTRIADIEELRSARRKGLYRMPPSLDLSAGTGALGKNVSAIHEVSGMNKHQVLGGRLRKEIYSLEALEQAEAWIRAEVISPTPYARYVEFGTRRSVAQPYLRPALLNRRQGYRERLIMAIKSQSPRVSVGTLTPEGPSEIVGIALGE